MNEKRAVPEVELSVRTDDAMGLSALGAREAVAKLQIAAYADKQRLARREQAMAARAKKR